MKQYLRPGVAFIVLVLLILTSRIYYSPTSSTAQVAKSKAQIATAAPANESREFARHIDSLIDQGPFASARWGIKVVSIANGSTIYERNARERFIPASNMKMYTTAAALDLLGGDYRWRTSVYVLARPDAEGTVHGDLILYGRGAPDLVDRANENSLEKLADAVRASGVKRVKGSVIADESYFRGNAVGDGWQWNDMQWYFGAEASALTVNGNEIDLNLLPPPKADATPEIRTSDTTGYVDVDNQMAPGHRAERSTLGVFRGLSNNHIEVWGELAPGAKGFGARLSVHNPALWASQIFLAALKSRDVTVDGPVSSRTSRSAPKDRFDPSKGIEIGSISSAPLSQIVRMTNKESNNLFAELILRTLGRERRAMLPPQEPSGREKGDDEAGTELIKLWLTRQGVSTDETALHDGSGLSRLNLVTPASSTQLLTASSSNQAFRDSLPVAGKDGTLAGRLRPLAGRVLAKTGSLIYVNSLSGYLVTANGETLAFAIYCNDYVGRGNSARLIDQIVVALADFPNPPSQNLVKR